ncbi:MAG: Biopolymer transport protein ExbD/TolR [Gemmatimonadetes bacterium]|nr:Biopolymer transport protein ExbD/TolR [Gemmatimonadota bacterium]
MSVTPAALRAEPNVTPMIDVMLVLLIIFMIVAPLFVTGFRAEPPKGANLTAHPEEARDAVIGIDAAGRYFYNREPVSESALIARLAQRFRNRSEDRVAYILADQSLAYARVEDALELAGKAGVRVVRLVSETPQQETRTGARAR